MSKPLNLVLFMGSARPGRLCQRVTTFVAKTLEDRGHTVQVIDPVEANLPVLETPHFFYPTDSVPEPLKTMGEKIRAAEGYVVVSPEYNHALPPALTNTMSHFGGSAYAYKPSAIVTYSPGQWGGMRAAMSLRPFLSELGCLPVSAILAFPHASQLFAEDGTCNSAEDTEKWTKYAHKSWGQLEWVGHAFKNHKANVGIPS